MYPCVELMNFGIVTLWSDYLVSVSKPCNLAFTLRGRVRTRKSKRLQVLKEAEQSKKHNSWCEEASFPLSLEVSTMKSCFKWKSKKSLLLLLFVCEFMYVNLVYAWCLQRSSRGVRSRRTGVTGSCKLPCGCWNLGTQEEYQVFCPAPAEEF